jgi:hypothetical protein
MKKRDCAAAYDLASPDARSCLTREAWVNEWTNSGDGKMVTCTFGGYGLYKTGVIGIVGLLVYAGVIGFTPIILAAIARPFFKLESLRPVSALGSA